MTDRIEEQRCLAKQILEKKVARERHASAVFANKLRALGSHPVVTKPLAKNVPLPKKAAPLSQLKEKDEERKPAPKKAKESGKKPQAKTARLQDTQNSELFLRLAAHMPSPDHATAPTLVAQPLPHLSPEIMDDIIESIERSISVSGQETMTIDLRGHVLSGARIKMSVQNRKLRLQFASADATTRALLRSSKRDFERRLKEKNLALSDFVVH